ncbi:hypothetical protein Cni_G10841 [Canna indica]|uniref:Uncharacterized protein n=1 Tax=Canna indica TaxID=4628 RepID=A0AAQ3K4Y7_9LILI|nr:hypothetical protein Cni_G10841 [Canna indica]
MDGDGEFVGGLVGKCIEAASASARSVEKWRRQRRTLEHLPSFLADALLRCIIRRRLLRYPSWLETFKNSVENVDLRGENYVGAEWLAYLGAFRFLRCLNLADCKGVNNSALWFLAGMDSLKELDLSRCSKVSDSGIKHVLSIHSLEKLHISEIGLTSEGVSLLSSLQNLKLLDLGGIPVTDKALCSLQVLTKLDYLDLWGSKISNKGVTILVMFPKLNFLNLAWTNVTKLPYLPSITSLNMSNCMISSIYYAKNSMNSPLSELLVLGTTFTDADEVFSCMDISYMKLLDVSRSSICNLHFLVKMDMIEHLDLSFCGITDDSVEYIAKAGKSLKYLNASNTKLTSDGVGALVGRLINLETLCLSNTDINDAALSYIALMPSLRVTDLSHTKIKGFAYESGHHVEKSFSLSLLQNLSRLESLNLEDTLIKDEAFVSLAFLKQLRCLYLKSDFLSDVYLHNLSPLSNLKFLGFRNSVLTDTGLLYFMPPKALRMLDLRGSWLLTKDTVLSFCKQYPQIEVTHESIGMIRPDRNISACSSGTSQTSEARCKGFNKPSENCKVTFIDERIKYSREEMLQLQLSPLSTLAPHHRHMLPKGLRLE